MAAAQQRPSVAFLAVARAADGAVLASCFDRSAAGDERADLEGVLAALLRRAAALAYPGWRDSCRAGPGEGCSTVYALADARGLAVYAAGVRGAGYPERVAQQLLRALAERVAASQGEEALLEAGAGSLTAPLKRELRALMGAYEDPAAVDQVAQVHEKVEGLKCVMQENVRQILEAHASVAALQDKSQTMTAAADKFVKQSVNLKRQVQCRDLKVKAMVIAFLCLLVFYLLLPVLT